MLVEILAAVGILWMALYGPAARAFLERPLVQWPGVRSFSLYLVHEPIVVSIALLLGPKWVPLTVLIGVPLSLVATQLFYYSVERPSHRLSRHIGRFAVTSLTQKKVTAKLILATEDEQHA